MDGRQNRQQCELGESKCDICEQHSSGTKRQAVEEEQEEPEPETQADTAMAAEEQRKDLERAMVVEERRVEIQQRRRTEQAVYELERLEQHLQRWSNACAICMLQANSAPPLDAQRPQSADKANAGQGHIHAPCEVGEIRTVLLLLGAASHL
ncbi:hypothetical protein P3342_012548 [Pyrenophora teres f. teres]|nr:hypothetical protein P3342_012548 [Pyrenophora teres f. teres]